MTKAALLFVRGVLTDALWYGTVQRGFRMQDELGREAKGGAILFEWLKEVDEELAS